ncbi:MAG: histidine phosphatase family protein [Cohaesibacteraceae bacterium]|nr:histidine phosphatase family protein [Cohaesibacteraceae bacterium]
MASHCKTLWQLQNRTEFFILRHGQTAWNKESRLQGQTEVSLDSTGRQQAGDAAQLLVDQNIRLIVSSPLSRALDTANIIADVLNIPVKTDAAFIERGFGALEGQHLVGIMPDRPQGLGLAYSTDLYDDAEPWNAVCARVLGATDKWLGEIGNGRILFVGHYAVMCAFSQQLCGEVQVIRNAEPYRFIPGDYAWDLTRITATND